MHRSHILARELRGIVVVVLVAAVIVWLFARLSNDRALAQAEAALSETTTTLPQTTTTSTTIAVDDNQRLCSLASVFREDLRALPINLVNLAGDSLTQEGAPALDVGMHQLGDIPEEIRQSRTVAAAEALASGASIPETTAPDTTTVAPAPTALPTPEIVDTDRIDPLESGLLGEPQRVALNFYTASSTLRLGTISADFASVADRFATFVAIGEGARWDLEELNQSEFSDQWTALATRPPFGIDETLNYIEETCSIRIGSGFVYREEAPELPILDEVFIPTPVDPGIGRPADDDGGGGGGGGGASDDG